MAAEYLAAESGILIILGYGLAAAWLMRRIGTHTAERDVVVRSAVARAA